MAQYKEYGFEGRTAIVTGAGSGIGEATAIELAKGGAKLALFGRRAEKLEKVKQECLKYTDHVLALSTDVGDVDSVKCSVGEVLEAYGKVDILINNAGIESRLKPGETFFGTLFDKLDEETYMNFFKIHSYGHYIMNLAVIPSMIENDFGRIVNTTSVTGIHGNYSTPAYTASKAAAICQTKAFAIKYGKNNITVNAIAPGMVDTPMKIDATPKEFEIVKNKTPLGRVASPIDIARVVLFFAQENLFVTGQCLTCDGGSDLA
jgi:NAD(P)-dependent dehydrogenase (short-subunit alcohol dehydrogenase family)